MEKWSEVRCTHTPRYADNLNSHDAGMLTFKNKRLVIFEELSPAYSGDRWQLHGRPSGSQQGHCRYAMESQGGPTFQ